MTTETASLKNLGPKSASMLASIGIHNYAELETIGAIQAYLKLERSGIMRPSLNLLYAMVGALEDRHWQTIKQQHKTALLLALDSARERKID